MNFQARLLISSLRILFGLDNVVFNNIRHFILITHLRLSLIRSFGYGLGLSLLDIVVGFCGGGIDVVGYFGLDGRFLQDVVAYCFAGSLLFFQVAIFLLSRFADICPRSSFYIKCLWIWHLICSFELRLLLSSFAFRHVFYYLFANSFVLLL